MHNASSKSPSRPAAHTLACLLPALLIACADAAPPPEASREQAGNTVQHADERIAQWQRERPGQPLPAAVSFRQLQPDSVVMQWLRRHRLQPYVVQVWAGGVSSHAQLPAEQADLRLIAAARAQLVQRLERGTCKVAARVQRMLGDRAAARRDSSDGNARSMLSRLRAEQEALRAVRAGNAVIWAIYLVGTPDAVRALGADPLVLSFEPVEFGSEGREPLTGVPRPAEPPPVGAPPRYADIDALPLDSVLKRLQQLAAEPARACAPPQASQTLTGHWHVVARRNELALLMEQPPRAEQRGPSAPAAPTARAAMIFAPDEPLQPALVRVVALALPGVPAERARPLHVGRVRLGDEAVFVSIPGHAPTLPVAPAADAIVFAEANALWLLATDGSVRRLTAERSGSFEYHALAQRQREGAVILYWAETPHRSPDGRFIAYVTNREAVSMNRSGQSIWLLNTRTRDERSLLSEPGEAFFPHGWLGDELVYGGREPGSFAINVQSGVRRRLTTGTFVAASVTGDAIVLADHVPNATRMFVLTLSDTSHVPSPPAASGWVPQASFSPGSTHLLLQAASAGRERTFYVFDRVGRTLQPVTMPGYELADWPQWLSEGALLLNAVDTSTRESRALVFPIAG